jgi:acetyl coenzyme A synthetase (ADP forming)-like protein
MPSALDSRPGACDALLADGSIVHVRPIEPGDEEHLAAFHAGLSKESIYLRFFSSHSQLSPDELRRFTHVDGRNRMALVATVRQAIVGVARYDRLEPSSVAEVAFVVTDAYQGRGVATLLLELLAAHARGAGIEEFRAQTLWENRGMQSVFRNAGFGVEWSHDRGVVDFRLTIRPTEAYRRALAERDEESEVRSIRHLLCPSSVAVVGAGRRPGTIGHEILRNIIDGGYSGSVFPIHPSATEILGRPAYKSLAEVPADVDVAVVAVPAGSTMAVVEDCAVKSVKGIVLITAGFAEGGDDGRMAQDEILATARAFGMRVVGPNCMGIINTSPAVSLNATFAPVQPEPGRVAFASQSGGLGIAVLQEAGRRGIGVSSFVSMGNKADVSGNDLLQYWHRDPESDVILLYLESFGNPRRFARIARRVSADKPIVAVKAGRSSSGRRAASSHTAALASSDVAVSALFDQAGVIRVDTLEEMFDLAQVLGGQPIPRGRRVAIVGNAGGPGILAADACEADGLLVPELPASTQARLREFLPAAAAVSNPVDMVASASAEDYERALSVVMADDAVDAVVVVFVPPLVTRTEDVADAVARTARQSTKPMVVNLLGVAGIPEQFNGEDSRIPCFAFPEPAVRALARACDYGDWRRRDPGRTVELDEVHTEEAQETVRNLLGTAPLGRWLDPAEASALLGTYGINTIRTVQAQEEQQAADAAERIGFPVALKAVGRDLIHKTELGGVRLGLSSSDEVRATFAEMKTALGDRLEAVAVQAMAPDGVEMIVGALSDPQFGPMVMFGTGGTMVELFADRELRMAPITDSDARRLISSVRGARLLYGYRGSKPADVEAIEDLLVRVGRLVDEIPEVAEIDLNPVICTADGVALVDTKVRVAPGIPRADDTVRRLR